MRRSGLKLLGIGLGAAALAGCAGAASQYVQALPEQPAPVRMELPADEVYLDGTGTTARRLGQTPDAAPLVLTRPAGRAVSVSSNTATRSSGPETQKPYTEEWREQQRREDARIKARMNICRGC